MSEDDSKAKGTPAEPPARSDDGDLDDDLSDIVFRLQPVSRGTIHGVLKFRGRGKPKVFADDFDK